MALPKNSPITISVLASTNYLSDARVLRSVRAFRDAGFSVDPILLSRTEPSLKSLSGSYGVQYTRVGPRRSRFWRVSRLVKRIAQRVFRAAQSKPIRQWTSGALILIAVLPLYRGARSDAVHLVVLAIGLIASGWLLQSQIWPHLLEALSNYLRSRLSKVEQGAVRATSVDLVAHLKMTSSDVILMHDMDSLDYVTSIRKDLEAKIVWDAHEFYPDVAGLRQERSDAYQALLQRIQFELDGFIVVNPMIRDEYVARYPAMPTSMIATNATRIGRLPDYDGRLHATAGIPRSHRILLYQGGVSAYRGLERLSDVAPLLPEDWVLVIMGSGNLLPALRKLAESAPANPRATPHTVFLPAAPHDELAEWTAGATLATILYEPTCLNQRLASPNKIWEYAAAGVPVLANDLPFIRSKVEEYDTGWLVGVSATPSELAETISGLSAIDLETKARNARAFAEAEDGRFVEEGMVRYVTSLVRDDSEQVSRGREV